jgi:hypothetical protein
MAPLSGDWPIMGGGHPRKHSILKIPQEVARVTEPMRLGSPLGPYRSRSVFWVILRFDAAHGERAVFTDWADLLSPWLSLQYATPTLPAGRKTRLTPTLQRRICARIRNPPELDGPVGHGQS